MSTALICLTILTTFVTLPSAFAQTPPGPTGDLLVMCESEAVTLDVRSVNGVFVANINYVEDETTNVHVGATFQVQIEKNRINQTTPSQPLNTSYCQPPKLPLRKFELNLSGVKSQLEMTLGYGSPARHVTISCWGIIEGSDARRP